MAHHKQRSITKMSRKKMNGILKLKNVVERLMQRKSLLSPQKSCFDEDHDHDEAVCDYPPPRDVKEGHFAVIAVDQYEPSQRFVVPLMFLEDPRFLKLLEQAAEEYGFDHDGALMVPCRPSKLGMILSEQ